jgi:hypothetical protein
VTDSADRPASAANEGVHDRIVGNDLAVREQFAAKVIDAAMQEPAGRTPS